MIKYKLEIKTPGRMIVFRNVLVRTPVTLIVTKKQLKQIKVQMNRLGIDKYLCHEISDNEEDQLPKSIVLNNEYEPDDQLSVPEIEILLRTGECK